MNLKTDLILYIVLKMSLHIENSIFKELINKYSTWPELHKYLESDEGGLFQVVDKNEGNNLCIIRYEKGSTNMDLPHSRWFRSVVWNTATNRPVCVAPPKASVGEFPFSTFNEISDASGVCQELLDGFMINCFRLAGDNTLHITSRSKLDATGKFYSDKSFRDLFIESYMATTGDVAGTADVVDTSIQSTTFIRHPDSSNNETVVFYSFLVQHKENRIVKDITENRVYLIHSGVVYDDGRIVMEDSPVEFAGKSNIESLKPGSLGEVSAAKGSWAQVLARNSENDGLNEVQSWLKNLIAEKSWDFQGVVFKDSVGNRWRFRNEKYTAVKSLRGNSTLVRDRFSQLYTQNLVSKYLDYYPEEATLMTLHLMMITAITDLLHDKYIQLHVTKILPIAHIDKMYHPHLYSIHGMYLTQLRLNGQSVMKKDIQVYLHKLPWQRLTFLLKKMGELLSTPAA